MKTPSSRAFGIIHYQAALPAPARKAARHLPTESPARLPTNKRRLMAKTFRCYAAMDEARRPNVRKTRWDNFDLLKGKTISQIVDLIVSSIKETGLKRGGTLRVHIGGDYFSQIYFNAWMKAASFFPNIVFYSYTKSIKFLLEYITAYGGLPKQFCFYLLAWWKV